MKFIATEFGDHAGADAERAVWERLKDCFGPDDVGVCYYQFPIVDSGSNELDREADFLLLHQEYGLVVVECKGYTIDQIGAIEGNTWELRGTSQEIATPLSQARDHGFRVRGPMTQERSLMDDRGNCEVVFSPLVALPNVSREEWEARGFDETPPADRVLVREDLRPATLRERIESLPGETALSQSAYRDARAVLSGGQAISGERESTVVESDTLAGLYDAAESGLQQLDEKQEEVGIQLPEGPQQIRGIAGSGKTIMLARKAAAMHAKHPEWNVAVTFNTRSLYDAIEDHVERFYADLGGEELNWDRLDVLHAWGGTREHGLYYKIAQEAGLTPRNVGTAKEAFGDGSPEELLDACCAEVIEEGEIQEQYDAILIDEAQDLEPSFYRMCYAALRPPKRLIWAYDEAQDLTSLSAPSPKRIFGTDEDGELRVDLGGSYSGGIHKSQIMRKSYRTPAQVLLLAHAFGMGLRSDRGAVQAITTKDGWEDIGYEVVRGDFRRTGEPVEIRRPAEHSPHPLQDRPEAQPFVGVETFTSKDDELDYVASSIERDVTHHGLDPEQVLVVSMGSPWDAKEVGERLDDALDERGLSGNLVWTGNKSVFAREGEVTISRINRAKGNEAAMVYLLNVESVENRYWDSTRAQGRNEAFVGLTRTRAWCRITGANVPPSITEELHALRDAVDEPEPSITFPAPDPTDLEREIGADDTMATTIDQF